MGRNERRTRDEGRGTWDVTSIVVILLLAYCLLYSSSASATARTPQFWSAEVKSGFWMPTNSTTEKFFDKCCNIVSGFGGGFLYKGKYGVDLGAGIMSEDGWALGAGTGTRSQDRFNLFLIPMETNAVWRADYFHNQIVVPYLKAGADYVFFRENVEGVKVKGLKSGLHAAGGAQFSLNWIDSDESLDFDYGINDLYFFLEARYGWINSFGKGGLDLSGTIYSAGLLFEF